MPAIRSAPRHLLGIEELATADLEALLTSATALKRSPDQPRSLAGQYLVNLFFEPSTRTRVSFEIAARRLGMDVVNWTAHGSSDEKGESLRDTAANVAAMGPAVLVVRHPAAGAAWLLARSLGCSVINAGDGAHEHPSQAILDALTLRERLGTLIGKTIAIVGDIAHSRVARSNLWCLTRLGAKVRLCGPASFLPEGIEQLGSPGSISVHTVLARGLEGVDAVMSLRVQHERLDGVGLPGTSQYVRHYGLTRERLAALAPGIPVLHPGPVNRGIELSSDLMDGRQSAILEQVENGVAVRMAILRWVLELA